MIKKHKLEMGGRGQCRAFSLLQLFIGRLREDTRRGFVQPPFSRMSQKVMPSPVHARPCAVLFRQFEAGKSILHGEMQNLSAVFASFTANGGCQVYHPGVGWG
jgi:hypothetical protein